MKLLLDTHIWIWSQLQPERLGRRVRARLRNANDELWLSPISVWEFMLLAERGRIVIRGAPHAWVERALRGAPIRETPLTTEIALRTRAIELAHDDPADRFLAATACVHDLTLVTADERLLQGSGFRTLANH